MHEASIARDILDKLIEEADKHGGGRIKNVKLHIGVLTHVLDDALRFAFDALAEETCAKGADIEIKHQPMTLICRDCQWRGNSFDKDIRCAACGGRDVETSGGNQICLVSFKMETND